MDINLRHFGGGGGGDAAGAVALPDALFARRYNASLAHQTLVSVMANARTGTRKQKTRAEVRHTRKKLFRQKGTGRARAGHSSTPLRRGGGRAFPASPHDNFQRKLPRKMYRAGMAVILSQLLREERLSVVRSFAVAGHKTRDFVKTLAAAGLAGKVLLVDAAYDDNLSLAARNVPGVEVLAVAHVLPTDLVAADRVVFSAAAIEKIVAQWSGAGGDDGGDSGGEEQA